MSKELNKLAVRLLQVLIVLTPVGLFLWLANITLAPSGVFVATRVVNERSPYLERLLPDARVEEPYKEADGDWVQKIIGDPVFFFVHPSRFLSESKTEIRFKNTGVPIVEFGLLADSVTGAYALEPLQNLLIDDSLWFRLEQEGLVLLQRNKEFSSLDEFIVNYPPRSEIATYHYSLNQPYRLADYQPSTETTTTNFFLRGSHEFYTYLKNETLNFKFFFLDENSRIGEDGVDIVVINEIGFPVAEEKFFDNSALADASSSWPLSVEISATDLPEGVYKIQLKTSDDIVFRGITTTQQKITFLNHLRLSDGGDYPLDPFLVNLVSGGKNFNLSTNYASAAQTVLFGHEPLEIIEPYLEYSFKSSSTSLTEISVPKNKDLLIRADGYFAFSPERYFNPDPIRLTAETDLDRSSVNYIIARYTPPRSDGEWLVAEATLPTTGAPFEDNTWKFVISAPTATEDERELLINSIKMTFTGAPLTFEKIWNKLSSYVLE